MSDHDYRLLHEFIELVMSERRIRSLCLDDDEDRARLEKIMKTVARAMLES